ncbi:hypothetical protein [Streptomyces virginiae]|uniref:hypothetical protein n=1 Tax=Streptomyces virginiae TaxID=1961 RepID=UPI003443753F
MASRIQRDAYASFLLAANRVQELGERFVGDNEADLSPETVRAGEAEMDDALVSLKAAQTVLELEGPDDVAAPAAGMTDAAQVMGYHLGKQAVYERALGRLGRMLDDQSPGVSAAAERLMDALAGLRSNGPSEQDVPTGRNTRSCSDARDALPPGTLDDGEFRALLEGFTSRPPALSSSYLDAVQRFRENEERFVRAAKIVLHAPPGS